MNIFIPIPFTDNFITTKDIILKKISSYGGNELKLSKGTILKFSSYSISKSRKDYANVKLNIFEPGKKSIIGERILISEINKLEGIEKMLTEEELEKEKKLKIEGSIGNLNDLV